MKYILFFILLLGLVALLYIVLFGRPLVMVCRNLEDTFEPWALPHGVIDVQGQVVEVKECDGAMV